MIAHALVLADGSVTVGAIKYASLKNAIKHMRKLGLVGTVGVKVHHDAPCYQAAKTLLGGTPTFDGIKLVREV